MRRRSHRYEKGKRDAPHRHRLGDTGPSSLRDQHCHTGHPASGRLDDIDTVDVDDGPGVDHHNPRVYQHHRGSLDHDHGRCGRYDFGVLDPDFGRPADDDGGAVLLCR